MNKTEKNKENCVVFQRPTEQVSTFEIDDDIFEKKENKIELLNKLTIGISEYFGTGLFVFLTCMGCISGINDVVVTPLHGSIAAGLAVMSMIQIFGHISGAHINPAVTIAALVMDHISLGQAGVYIGSQIGGALTGFALLLKLTPEEFLDDTFCVTLPHDSVSVGQAIVVEIVLTSVLALACCASWDTKNSKHTDSAGLRIGLLVAVLCLAGGPYTGASMNPARSIGPALWNNHLNSHYIYWLGPCTGGALAGCFYKKILLK